ncbi:hypothetical protein HU200_006991 [Digitaria exilis]|uniref:Uncharacterized protein n=1 Tax=Digitaria exilis TaxID=1010633 RepID=A0A835KV19_9POAL|nr:hypothetical protein HU200_006991 [Digitaria exilis]
MVPEFKGTIVRAQEEGTANAIQTAAREAVRWVHAEISERLEDTPYRYLPQALFTQKHLAENVRRYHRDALAEPEEQLRVAARCIHAMDRELHRRDQDVGMATQGEGRAQEEDGSASQGEGRAHAEQPSAIQGEEDTGLMR